MRDAMRLLIIPLLVVLAFGGWSGYWLYAANQVETVIGSWIERQRAAGAEISHAGLKVSGYPFRIRVDLEGPRMALPANPAQPRWRAERLSAISHPWTPQHIIVDLSGWHALDAVLDGTQRSWRLDSPNALASWSGEASGRLQRLSVDLQEVKLQEDGSERLKALRLQLHVRPQQQAEQDGFDLAMDTEQAVLSWPLPPAFGPEVARARAQISINGALPWTLPPPQALATWRDQGGTIDVRALSLEWGRLNMTGEGTVALDDAMRPMGALTAKLSGYEVLLQAARDDGQITPGAANAAKAVLGLLAAANGGMLSVPVRLQDGEAFLGPVLIARLSPLLPPP